MNNKFLADYLIQNFGDQKFQFNPEKYKSETILELSQIQSQIEDFNKDLLSKNDAFKQIEKEISEKNSQFSKLENFIKQKSPISSLKTQIDNLSNKLELIRQEIQDLEQSKIKLSQEISSINISIQRLVDKKSNLEDSIKPDFQETIDNYIQSKKEQIINILSQNEDKKENQKSEFGKDFDTQTKDQYPFEEFKDAPEILQELQSTFDAEKDTYVSMGMETYKTQYSQNIVDIFQQAIDNYQLYKKSLNPILQEDSNLDKVKDTTINVDISELNKVYISRLKIDDQYFPYFTQIHDILNYPLFKKQGDITRRDMMAYHSGLRKLKDKKKFEDIINTINNITIDYGVPMMDITQEGLLKKSSDERDSIVKDMQLQKVYSEYIKFNREHLEKLGKIVDLLHEKRSVNFKGFEDIVINFDNIIRKYIDLNTQNNGSIYLTLNTLSKEHIDDLNDLNDRILDLVDKNNLSKSASKQIIIYENIIQTIKMYLDMKYSQKGIDLVYTMNNISNFLIDKMFLETFMKDMTEDYQGRKEILSLAEDTGFVLGMAVLGENEHKNIRAALKLSGENIVLNRKYRLLQLLMRLEYLGISQNINDFCQKTILENNFDQGDRKICGDLYTTCPEFDIPPLDPILIAHDKFGIANSDYVFETYNLKDSQHYLAYIRMFHLEKLKHYEEMKQKIYKNGKNSDQKELIDNILKVMLTSEGDFKQTGINLSDTTSLFVHKDFELSIDGINSQGLKYIIGEKNYEMLRTYIFYNFLEANREHETLITTPKELISPCLPKQKLPEAECRIITINPDMQRTISVSRGTGMTKDFLYKRDTIVMLNPKSTTSDFGFNEAKKHNKELYAYVHKIKDYPTRENCVEKIRLDTCETYEDFLEQLEMFRKKHENNEGFVVRVETYRSEFEKYEGAKQNVVYKIGNTKNSPKNILEGGKKKRGRPPKNPE